MESSVAVEKIKLNLGCGDKIWPGFINVDSEPEREGKKPDVIADVGNLPFPNSFADEIHAIHIIEHFHLWEVGKVMDEWVRVLKKGGKMIIECPDIEKILALWTNGAGGLAKTWYGLYGDQSEKDPKMTHKWCYSYDQLHEILLGKGMFPSYKLKPEHHFWFRDMRIEAVKWRG